MAPVTDSYDGDVIQWFQSVKIFKPGGADGWHFGEEKESEWAPLRLGTVSTMTAHYGRG